MERVVNGIENTKNQFMGILPVYIGIFEHKSPTKLMLNFTAIDPVFYLQKIYTCFEKSINVLNQQNLLY